MKDTQRVAATLCQQFVRINSKLEHFHGDPMHNFSRQWWLSYKGFTLLETNIFAPANGWLEDEFSFGARQIFSNLMEVLQLFSSGRNGLAGDLCVYLNYFGAVTSPKHTDKVAQKKALVEEEHSCIVTSQRKIDGTLGRSLSYQHLINPVRTGTHLVHPARSRWCARQKCHIKVACPDIGIDYSSKW